MVFLVQELAKSRGQTFFGLSPCTVILAHKSLGHCKVIQNFIWKCRTLIVVFRLDKHILPPVNRTQPLPLFQDQQVLSAPHGQFAAIQGFFPPVVTAAPSLLPSSGYRFPSPAPAAPRPAPVGLPIRCMRVPPDPREWCAVSQGCGPTSMPAFRSPPLQGIPLPSLATGPGLKSGPPRSPHKVCVTFTNGCAPTDVHTSHCSLVSTDSCISMYAVAELYPLLPTHPATRTPIHLLGWVKV